MPTKDDTKPRSGDTNAELQGSQASLRDIVKQAMLGILSDPAASAAAKASAGRTLLDHFDDHEHAHGAGKRGAELSLAELDEEIASLSTKR